MDSTLRGMLNAVIAEPEQLHLRLICADRYEELEETVDCPKCDGVGAERYVDDSGDCGGRACMECKGTGRVSNGMKARADQIRDQFKPSPFRHMTAIGGTPGRQDHIACEWERGFIAKVVCTMAQWEQHGPSICDQHPVERVVITDKEPDDSPSGWTYYGIDGGGFDSMHVPVCIQKEPRPDMYFPSVESANADLSAHCIAWAREQAYQLTTCDRPG